MKYDYIIVGSGLFGSVFAQQCKKKKLKALVIDQQSHIAGNCYSEKIDDIHIHRYGPHIFHTSNEKVWSYIQKFSKFEQYHYSPVGYFKGKSYSLPFNMWTFNQLWNISDPEVAKRKIESQKQKNIEVNNLENMALSTVGKEIYEKFIYGYTKKQWRQEPRELPASIIKRIPIRYTYDNNYYFHKFQGIPIEGYTKIFENLLDGIKVELDTHYSENIAKFGKNIIYTGKIDEFFNYEYGQLEYRGLKFIQKKYDTDNYQGNAVINYTSEMIPYTRSIEHKHFDRNCKNNSSTIITYEHPIKYHKKLTPYYPVNTEKNNELYAKYKELASKQKNIIFGGRLGSYQYLDMDQTIASSLNLFKKLNK